ncbi:MAG TPA: serine protease [Burkholderiaceae bacterium]|nr:serine protease [Burkholderiaceae bacterium]
MLNRLADLDGAVHLRALALTAMVAALLGAPPPAIAGLQEVIVAAKPSVVAVGTYNPTDSPRFGFRGSGFVIGDGNLVVTNAHVLPETVPAGASVGKLVVYVPTAVNEDTRLRTATTVGLDRAHDLALLRIDGAPLPPLRLAADTPAAEGLAVAIIGFPIGGVLGFSPVTHRGIVSSVTPIALPAPTSGGLNARAVHQLRSGSFDIYQLDATAYPGNSGGPVIDADTGRVVAVINMVLVKGSKESAIRYPSGISYAVPVRLVADLLKER